MPTKECCRNCQHCVADQNSFGNWCRLRKIRVHDEISLVAFCHHWTNRPTALPRINDAVSDSALDRQLEFERELASIDS